MDMAASQARFLNLTARKTNIEYEGQQINQQRTTLANQSANLYNQMLTLTVPTPPNVQDYTRLVYTFKVPGINSTATVSQMTKDSSGTYTIAFSYSVEEIAYPACTNEQKSNVNSKTAATHAFIDKYGYMQFIYKDEMQDSGNKSTVNDPSRYYIDSEGWLRYNASAQRSSSDAKAGFNGNEFKSSVQGGYTALNISDSRFTPEWKDKFSVESADYNITTYKGQTIQLNAYNGAADAAHKDVFVGLCGSNGDSLYWANVGTEESPKYIYYRGSELAAAASHIDPVTPDPHSMDTKVPYYMVAEVDKFYQSTYTGCNLTRDANNRVLSIGYNGEDIAVSSITETDKVAYDDAMNEYTYKSYLYEQEMNSINAKTSVIQQQDKTLELRLKQLDTEENAIKSEMESVKGVVKDNIDRSFKSFA